MVRRALRSTSLRKVQRKTPTGKNVIHYERRKPSKASCSSCKKPLLGVPRLRQAKVSKLPKNQKRPERIYGGVLCSPCTRSKISQSLFSNV